jgi:prophage regulatory protein
MNLATNIDAGKSLIPVSEVVKRIGISRTTLWRLVQAGQFINSYRLSPGRVAFRLADVEAWIESRKETA